MVRLDREMALDAAQFRRELIAALPLPLVGQDDRTQVFANRDGQSITVTAEQLPPRRIASLTLPRLAVSLRLDGFSDAEAKAVLTRFERSFQRGGG